MMKHKTLDELRDQARITALTPEKALPPHLVRRQRLERLATVLEQHQSPIRPLSRIEYLPQTEWDSLRSDQSPLTVAYADPVLREQGLASDRLGDAMAFFQLSPDQTHELLCDCHYAGPVSPGMIASRARALARRVTLAQIWHRVRAMFSFG
jgi:hypothetical protein